MSYLCKYQKTAYVGVRMAWLGFWSNVHQQLGVIYQQLLKTANRKLQNKDYGLWMVEKHVIMHKLNIFDTIRDRETSDIMHILL